MKVVGLLCWYDEPESWLAASVASLAKLCDHVVAVDGAWVLFPDATRKPTSPPGQAETIMRTAAAAGMGCTVHVPSGPWWGNQVEKRDFMFQVGQAVADPGDWYLRIDADEVLARVPADTKARLEASEADVAEALLWQRNGQQEIADLVDASPDYRTMLRVLYRAQPDLHITQAHYVVTAGDRVLSGNTAVHDIEPALSLPDVVLEHHTGSRSPHRKRMKTMYEESRAELGVEAVAPLGGVGAAR